VEVPFNREVLVPTTHTKLVPQTVQQRVPVKKLVEVPSVETVQEPYTTYEQRETIRNKEIWVRRVVPERVIEKVPVIKYRSVQKPTTVIKEVEEYQIVDVPTTVAVQVPGVRQQLVPDTKIVEIEEYQDFVLQPQAVGPPQHGSSRDVGRVGANDSLYSPQQASQSPLAATIPAGALYPPPAALSPQQQQPNTITGSYYQPSDNSTRQLNIHASSLNSTLRNAGSNTIDGTGSQRLNNNAHVDDYRQPAGAYKKLYNVPSVNPEQIFARLGLKLEETHTRHTEGTGVTVTDVFRGGIAAVSGIHLFDIITVANNRPTQTVDEFCQVIAKVPSGHAVEVLVNRDGRRNVRFTLRL